ncbi:hypothetical protein D3C74_297180 [compost metagenome]
MKSKITVSTIVMFILILFSFSQITSANNIINKVSFKIEKVTYSSIDNVFYVYTEKDKNDSFWVIDINTKNMTLKQAKKKYINHIIDIYYTGDEQNDNEIEIVKTEIK